MKIHCLEFSPIQVNTYIIAGNSGTCALIDCGCYNKEEFDRLKAFLSGNGLTPGLLLNTHCHLDHVFGNGYVLEEWGLKTRAHRNEQEILKAGPLNAQMFGLEMDSPPPVGDFLEEGDLFEAGDTLWKVLFVPGHTPGHLAFYSEEKRTVFTGDVLFRGGIGRTDLPGGNHEQLMHSIRHTLGALPPDTKVYAGHGPSTGIGYEIKTNPFLQ